VIGRTAAAFGVLLALTTACSGWSHSASPATTALTIRSSGTTAPQAGFLSIPLDGDGHTAMVWRWDGTRTVVLHTSAVADCCTTVSLSPDGTRLQVLRTPQGADIIDLRTGRVTHAAAEGTWADDSRHRCELRPTHPGDCCGPVDLFVIDLDGTAHRIATVGSNTSHGGPGVLLCSVTAHRALISNSFIGQVDGLEAVSLVNAPVITPILAGEAFPALGAAVSGNGRYLATRTLTGTGQTVVYDLQNHKTVGQALGTPVAMSWDGRYVVTETDQQAEVFEWRTGTIVWHSRPSTNSSAQLEVAARPDTDDLAINVASQPGQPYRSAELWLLTTHRPPRLIAQSVLFGVI